MISPLPFRPVDPGRPIAARGPQHDAGDAEDERAALLAALDAEAGEEDG